MTKQENKSNKKQTERHEETEQDINDNKNEETTTREQNDAPKND